MEKVFSRRLGFILLGTVLLIFTASYLTFTFAKQLFPNPGLRNRNYTPAILEEVASGGQIVSFKNSGENIYATVDTSETSDLTIYGYANETLKEQGTLTKNNDGLYEFTFNFDYFDINRVSVNFAVNKINVYYIR